MQSELGQPLFVRKQSRPLKKEVISLRCLVHQAAEEYQWQLELWYKPHLVGEALQEAEFFCSRKEIHKNIALDRVMKALVKGRLKAFVLGSSPAYIWQAQPSFWCPQDDSFNADALLSGIVMTNPFGMASSLDLHSETVNQTLYLSKGKATGWLKQSPKLHRIKAPDALLQQWYDAIPDDDPVKRSLRDLRLKARKKLRMRVSEVQIDQLVAGEGRKRGRPSLSKTPVAAL